MDYSQLVFPGKASHIVCAREAAYLAVLASLDQKSFIFDFLDQWRKESKPTLVDFQLAQEIAYGACRMALSLDYLALQLNNQKKLILKTKEKVLLRTALYQHVFLDRIPPYAIVNETINIGKRHCHKIFVRFLNALLRKMEDFSFKLPQGHTLNELSLRYSYPSFFIEALIADYGLEKTIDVLVAGNKPAPTVVRIRSRNEDVPDAIEGLKIITTNPCKTGVLQDSSLLAKVASSSKYYIQNVTPALLTGHLCLKSPQPKTILDLCASPGGKLLIVHEFFSEAKIFANDISPDKVRVLQENCDKYSIPAVLSCSKGEMFKSDRKFDLIILDVPCSNTGVLNKRPEARWRLSEDSLEKLEAIQLGLIAHAATLLAPGGSIWYMTCSILKRENEYLIEKGCRQFGLTLGNFQEIILPNEEGWDGGFACKLVQI